MYVPAVQWTVRDLLTTVRAVHDAVQTTTVVRTHVPATAIILLAAARAAPSPEVVEAVTTVARLLEEAVRVPAQEVAEVPAEDNEMSI